MTMCDDVILIVHDSARKTFVMTCHKKELREGSIVPLNFKSLLARQRFHFQFPSSVRSLIENGITFTGVGTSTIKGCVFTLET